MNGKYGETSANDGSAKEDSGIVELGIRDCRTVK